MAQGILGGIGLGAVFSVGVAGVISVLVPIEAQRAPELGTAETVAQPQEATIPATVIVTGETGNDTPQPQVSLRVPSGEELPKEPEPAALAPQVTSDLEYAVEDVPVASSPVTAPSTEIAALAPLPSPLGPLDTNSSDADVILPDPLPQPETGDVSDLVTPDPIPEEDAVTIAEDAPVLPNPQALAPMIPDDSADSSIAEQTAELPQQQGEETFVVVTPAPAPETDETEGTPVVIAPKPRVVSQPGTQVATLNTAKRPTIGRPASTLINRATPSVSTDTKAATPQARVAPEDATPLQRYAQPFENPQGKPLMSIVLMDTGVDLDAGEIGLPALSSFPYPVSFAVDVRLVDAAKRMERYRAEGFDVLGMLDLPEGARPSDAEVSLSVTLNGLPEIVGILEGTGEGLQGSRTVADQVTNILKASGHGLVTQNKGLNSMPKLAVKAGVPAAPVFRDFDSAGQQPRVIRRFLDQAAFKAGQEGGVIMLGRLRPETIEALLVWGLADRAGSVALAPVSAVLLNRR